MKEFLMKIIVKAYVKEINRELDGLGIFSAALVASSLREKYSIELMKGVLEVDDWKMLYDLIDKKMSEKHIK